ncbi:hypothetical protein [Pseudanabaena sp. FACHB-2040]|uniref:hypothetical protein n=1 Tax=Pseudanabaena sp. FACHB-2040 TaxID=2692859 RepID=UPI001682B099|nr:hypothetical protein [Pseudanabaena sp. FACHB-2040]MBD2261189.1 hypothetical protein [Pseudanabaena sp. FACHB-2040]
MTNPSSDAPQNIVRFSWAIFFQRLTQASFVLLCIGAVLIVLWHFNGSVDVIFPNAAEPLAFLGGAIVLVTLTLLGVPVVAATAAGVAIWLAIQNFL